MKDITYSCPRVGSGRVCAQPRTNPSELSDKKMHPPRIVGVIGSGGSDHQRAAGGLIGIENPENNENPA